MTLRLLERFRARRVPTDPHLRISAMRVGIVDVGANTLRLLVATRTVDGRLDPLREDRRQLGLGEELERNDGVVGAEKLEEVAAVARTHARRARKLGAATVLVLVTSPGRQAANGEELVATLRRATDCTVRVLSAEEEGSLAWFGAVAAADDLDGTVAVCDVGGGSAQLVVGAARNGPSWSESIDLGSLRLTKRCFQHDPPTARELERASQLVAESFAGIAPPPASIALATGGTARALRKMVGAELGEAELATALRKLAKRSSREISKDFGLDRARARTVTAGTMVLAEVQRCVNVPLVPARGGLREGAALALLEDLAVATA